MSIHNQNFVYLNWRVSANPNHRIRKDNRCSVEVMTSVGPYKHTFADFVMQKNSIYYWEVRIVQGNYFKIGVIKESAIQGLSKGAFCDSKDGYGLFSTGKLRHGSNSTGDQFGVAFGAGDIVKVEFNTKDGTLKFGKNEELLKVAFTVPQFKKGGFVAVVAALTQGSMYCLTAPGLED